MRFQLGVLHTRWPRHGFTYFNDHRIFSLTLVYVRLGCSLLQGNVGLCEVSYSTAVFTFLVGEHLLGGTPIDCKVRFCLEHECCQPSFLFL